MEITYENYKGGIKNMIVVRSNGITTTGLSNKDKVVARHKKKLMTRLAYLSDRLDKLGTKLYEQQCKEHEKLSRVGWGASMRGYKHMRMTFPSEVTQNRINEVKQDMAEIKQELGM